MRTAAQKNIEVFFWIRRSVVKTFENEQVGALAASNEVSSEIFTESPTKRK